MIRTFRKKPVEIQAIQFTGDNADIVAAWIGDGWTIGPMSGALIIHTLEGNMTAGIGDWIIRGVRGEFYPCKPDIFEATYEPSAESETPQP